MLQVPTWPRSQGNGPGSGRCLSLGWDSNDTLTRVHISQLALLYEKRKKKWVDRKISVTEEKVQKQTQTHVGIYT